MIDARYDWKNLTAAERMVQNHKDGHGLTCSWYATFEARLFPVAVALAKRVLYLEKEVRRLKREAKRG